MKRTLLILLGIFILVTLTTFVSAEEIYFNQCIRVYDSNGSNMIGLDCTFKDDVPIFNDFDMIDMSNGLYCININDSFPDSNYTFTSKCSDGNITRVVHGEFIVGAGEPEWNWIYIGLLLIPFFLIIIAKKTEDPIFTFFGGLVLSAFVPIIYSKGYPNFTDTFILNIFALILLGIGFYLIISSALKMIEMGGES